MSKILVLAEKPSVARDIGRVLKCSKKGNGYLEGDKYIVTWALGHLVTLSDPEQYDNKYKQWNIEDVPIIPKSFKFSLIKTTIKQFNAVKGQLSRDDVKEIVIATDAGREGELVARLILYKAGVKKPIKRLWISSVTDKAIKEGFSKLRDGREYNNLYASALSRAEADWVVGINATRTLTCKYNAQLSCGRVQTPTLAMVSYREDEIRDFKPKNFYSIEAVAKGVKLKWTDKKSKENRSFNEDKIDSIVGNIKGEKLYIEEVNKKVKKLYSQGLYDLTQLQRDANRIWGYSAKETLSIMQKLYEQHKVLTYPRTDSKYISDDIVETLKDRVKACRSVNPDAAKEILALGIKANKSFVDNSKVSDHHAIIPTEEAPVWRDISVKERNIYELVSKRFLAALMKPCEYEEVVIVGNIKGEEFKARGKKVIYNGWKDVYDNNEENEDEENQIINGFNKGESINIDSIEKKVGKTTPPSLLNEGTLLAAMENPSKYMKSNDSKIIKTLGETGGLGTVATRADIIEKLFSSFLIEKRGKDIITTSKGRQLLKLAPKELVSPELTGRWEQKLQEISRGKLNKDSFMEEIIEYTKSIVSGIKSSEDKYRHDNLSSEKCPECGKNMLSVNTKKGRSLVCQDRECGHRQSVAILTNARCPDCKKKLELRGSGDGKIYACTNLKCNFREKESIFKKRFNKSDKVNKKEVHNIMAKMKKEAEQDINNPFAELLKDFNK
ncbi:DNA topoisomerase III [Clostridium cylindrosporum]|uniref:DNA topoisomerase 3 n=1 Tax=Clostridium cylindrosporum DSM 605 TaxID=1121307 RepID=A0A0J8D563_CLOCY|nr:DNA topoisomerase III [Clostridium cylindrosporum]KMT20957.1 DNA topoisomerase 3 [Clostridium cylindrosporum DSM 605]